MHLTSNNKGISLANKSVAIIGTRGYPSYYGGFETAVRKLAPYLADEGWDVIVYGRPGGARNDDPTKDSRIKTVITSGLEKKSFSTITFGYTACRDAARRGVDVALVMNVANGFWLPILNRSGIPSLVNVDGIEWDRAKWGRLAKFVFRKGAKCTAKHGTRLVYDSVEIAKRWKEEFGLEGDFIPYGGDAREKIRVVSGLRNRSYVLFVARFVPENSVLEFFEAVPEIAKYTDVVIVGSSGYGGELDKAAFRLADENRRVHLLGHVSDDNLLHSLWQNAGVYFHGHSVGGTNPALVQAMALGAPIVARDTVYNREVLGADGIFVTPTRDSITDGILSILKDRQQMQNCSARNIERAVEKYQWEEICREYSKSLDKLLTSKSQEVD